MNEIQKNSGYTNKWNQTKKADTHINEIELIELNTCPKNEGKCRKCWGKYKGLWWQNTVKINHWVWGAWENVKNNGWKYGDTN